MLWANSSSIQLKPNKKVEAMSALNGQPDDHPRINGKVPTVAEMG
ncbi:hypothetical protein [Brevibacillus antibioticus]|nr:hypothetical protein [Brevibacillus antibioticus]